MLLMGIASLALAGFTVADIVKGAAKHEPLRYGVRMVLSIVYAWYAFSRWYTIKKEQRAQNTPVIREEN
jgi:hypothetical protein